MARFLSILKVDIGDGKPPRQWVLKPNSAGRGFSRSYGAVEEGEIGEPFTIHYTTWHEGYGETRRRTTPWERQGVYDYASGVQATHMGVLTPGPAVTSFALGAPAIGAPRYYIQGGSRIYYVGSAGVKKLTPSSDTVQATLSFTGGGTGQPAEYNGFLWVPGGQSGTTYRITPNGANPDTDTSVTAYDADHFLSFSDRLWRMIGNDLDAATADPTDDANFLPATPYEVGDPGYSATGMVRLNRYGYVGKPEGFFGFDVDGNPIDVLPDVNSMIDARNCQNTFVWHGQIWIPHIAGLYRYDLGGASRNLGPEMLQLNESVVRGRVIAGTGVGEWQYIYLEDNTADAWILAGKERTNEEAGLSYLVYHPLVKVAGGGAETNPVSYNGMLIDKKASTTPRLWFGDSSTNANYIKLAPDGSPDIYHSNYVFKTSGDIFIQFSQEDLDHPGVIKVIHAIEYETEQTSTTKTWTFGLAWDRSTTFTNVHSVGSVYEDGGYGYIILPPDFNNSGRIFQFKATAASDSATTPPMLRRFSVHGYLLHRTTEIFEADIAVGDITLPDGRKSYQSPEALRGDVETMFKKGPIKVTGPQGGLPVEMILTSFNEVFLPSPNDSPPQSVMRLRFRKTSFSKLK